MKKICFILPVVALYFTLALRVAFASPDCQTLPLAGNVSPNDGALRVGVFPQLQVAIGSGTWRPGPCGWSQTYWQIVKDRRHFKEVDFVPDLVIEPKEIKRRRDKIAKFTVFTAITPIASRARIKLNKALQPGTTYWWRASIGYTPPTHSVSGDPAHIHLPNWGGFSQPSSFTTPYVSNGKCLSLPVPYVLGPHSGRSAGIAPVLNILSFVNPGEGVDPPCKAKMADWQISADKDFSSGGLITSGKTSISDSSNGSLSFQTPPQTLKGNKIYFWRARVRGLESIGSSTFVASPWTVANEIRTPNVQPLTMRSCPNMNPPLHVEPAHFAITTLTPVLQVATQGMSPGCSWDKTAWQIFDPVRRKYVFQTGFTTQAARLAIPSGILANRTEYLWRVKIRAVGKGRNRTDVDSDWTPYGRFRTY